MNISLSPALPFSSPVGRCDIPSPWPRAGTVNTTPPPPTHTPPPPLFLPAYTCLCRYVHLMAAARGGGAVAHARLYRLELHVHLSACAHAAFESSSATVGCIAWGHVVCPAAGTSTKAVVVVADGTPILPRRRGVLTPPVTCTSSLNCPVLCSMGTSKHLRFVFASLQADGLSVYVYACAFLWTLCTSLTFWGFCIVWTLR